MQTSENESPRKEPAIGKKPSRRAFKLACGFLLVLLLAAFLLPGLPWSARSRHTLRRIVVKAQMQLARWRGDGPRLVSLSGRTNAPGIEIHALDSRSGWAALADGSGNFLLPDVIWYPGASYDLVFSSDGERGRLVRITPSERPNEGAIDIGELDAESGREVESGVLQGVNHVSYVAFDEDNRAYYKNLFDKLTAGEQTDQGKILAVNVYVSTKLNYEQPKRQLDTAREVLERGSKYCGQLANAFATLLASAGYRTRAIDLIDRPLEPHAHVVVEVFYEGTWHLFDPTYGVVFQSRDGAILRYRDLRLEPALINEERYGKLDEESRRKLLAWLPRAYASGFHHYYYFKGER